MCDSRKVKWMRGRAGDLESSVRPCLAAPSRLEALRPWGQVIGSALRPVLEAFICTGGGEGGFSGDGQVSQWGQNLGLGQSTSVNGALPPAPNIPFSF